MYANFPSIFKIFLLLPLLIQSSPSPKAVSFQKHLSMNRRDVNSIQENSNSIVGHPQIINWIKLGAEIGAGLFEKIISPQWILLKGKDESRDTIFTQKISDRTVYKISGTFAAGAKQVIKAIKFLEENQKSLAPIANAKIVKMECSLGPVKSFEYLFMGENESEIIGSGGIVVLPNGRNETKFELLFDLELEEWSGLNPMVLTATLLPDFMRSILFAQSYE